MRFRDIRESNFPHWKTAICGTEKECSGNIINTGVYEDFWRTFAQNDTKTPQKALGFSVKPDALSRHRQKSLFQWENSILQHRKKLLKKHYKHCRLQRLWMHFAKRWQNPPRKLLGVSLKPDDFSRPRQS